MADADKIDPQAREFNQRLKYYRETAGVTQTEMAKAAGLSPNYLSAMERGLHKCSASTLITYARKCGVSVDEISGLGSKTNLIPRLVNQLSGIKKEDQEKIADAIDALKRTV